jgi:hypothetical protein
LRDGGENRRREGESDFNYPSDPPAAKTAHEGYQKPYNTANKNYKPYVKRNNAPTQRTNTANNNNSTNNTYHQNYYKNNSNQMNTNQMNTNQMNTNQMNTNQMNTNQINTGQINNNQNNDKQYDKKNQNTAKPVTQPALLDEDLEFEKLKAELAIEESKARKREEAEILREQIRKLRAMNNNGGNNNNNTSKEAPSKEKVLLSEIDRMKQELESIHSYLICCQL